MDIIDVSKKSGITLNEQQLEAIRSTDHPTLLLAVPGSGKTTVLVIRLGFLIFNAGVRPEEILTLTYTTAATRDMKARFSELFGAETAERVEFRTINGLCAKVIAVYGKAAHKTAFELLSDEGEKQKIIAENFVRFTHKFPTENDLKNVSALITYIKNTQLSREDIDALGTEQALPLFDLYESYNKVLKEKNLMDYDDQMVYAYRILKRAPAIADYFKKRYRYISVDEVQDTSKLQHMIIELLSGNGEHLFMVGDEDQSIYGFRAADPESMLSFGRRYPNSKVLMLEENHRSTKAITTAADRFIKMNRFRYSKAMKTGREEGDPVGIIPLKKRAEQYDYLTECLRVPEADTAVLYRDNESAIPLVDRLERQGIPYSMRGADSGFFTHKVVTDIRNLIRFAYEPDNTELFLQIYYKVNFYINKNTALRLCMDCDEQEMTLTEALERSEFLPPRIAKNAADMMQHFETLKNGTASEALFLITSMMGYSDYLERVHMSADKLDILRALSKNEATALGLIERLDALSEILKNKKVIPDARVTLSTIHSAKGLEFDTVYLIDVSDGIFPENMIPERRKAERKALERYEEERRIFYVGVTRAKNRLFVFDIDHNSSFIRELTGEDAPEIPDIFVPARTKIKRQAPRTVMNNVTKDGDKKQPLSEAVYTKKRQAIEQSGKLVHKRYGAGKLLKLEGDTAEVEFAEKTGKFNLRMLIDNGLIDTEFK